MIHSIKCSSAATYSGQPILSQKLVCCVLKLRKTETETESYVSKNDLLYDVPTKSGVN